jgi:hypothetical protein
MPPKRKTTYSDLSLPKSKITKEYSNSITSLNSLSEKDERILSDIRKFRQPTNQQKLAQKLKNYYLDNNPNETWEQINDKDDIDDNQLDFFQKFNINFNLEEDYKKQLLFPSTLLNFMSLINNLKLFDIDSKNYQAYQYDILAYFLTIINTINIKVLYVICNGENYYLSPLNLKKITTQLRKKKININYANIYDLNEQLKIQYKVLKYKAKYKIDASKYDFVFISSSFEKFNITTNKLQVFLSNIDLKQHYKASLLRNTNHAISINKCNQYNILNTTWQPFNIYNITDFEDYDLYIDDDEKLYYVDELIQYLDPIKKYKYYYLKHNIDPLFEYSLFTINLYSNRASLKTKIYKQIEGGTIELKENIPDVSVCSDIFFPNNLYEFCWFSSIINSLFYTDDIAAIFLNKSIRHMDKTLKFFNDFYVGEQYKTINFKDQKELKKILKHVIYLMSFIYCSYSILSKNQLDERITNKKKWYEIYVIITNDETYKIIATIILGLSNIKKMK